MEYLVHGLVGCVGGSLVFSISFFVIYLVLPWIWQRLRGY